MKLCRSWVCCLCGEVLSYIQRIVLLSLVFLPSFFFFQDSILLLLFSSLKLCVDEAYLEVSVCLPCVPLYSVLLRTFRVKNLQSLLSTLLFYIDYSSFDCWFMLIFSLQLHEVFCQFLSSSLILFPSVFGACEFILLLLKII